MATIDVVLDPEATKCTRVKVIYPKTYKDHQPTRYRVTVGDGARSNRILCVACSYPIEREAIRRAEQRAVDEEAAQIAAEAERRLRSPGQKFWGWVTAPIAVIMLAWHVWLLAAVAAVVGLVFFLFVAPVRCREKPAGMVTEPCTEWGHGLLRGCHDEHQHQRNTALIAVVGSKHEWPTAWEARLAKAALVGAGLSVVLLVIAGVSYLLTRLL